MRSRTMIKVETTTEPAYFVLLPELVNSFVSGLDGCDKVTAIKTFTEDIPFEELPGSIQQEVKSTLKAYNRAQVTYENMRFHESTGSCIKHTYSGDFYFCGEYFAKDIYAEEERRNNFLESFGYLPRI